MGGIKVQLIAKRLRRQADSQSGCLSWRDIDFHMPERYQQSDAGRWQYRKAILPVLQAEGIRIVDERPDEESPEAVVEEVPPRDEEEENLPVPEIPDEEIRAMLARGMDLRPLFDDGGKSLSILRKIESSVETDRSRSRRDGSAVALYMQEAMAHRILSAEETSEIFRSIESIRHRLASAVESFRIGERFNVVSAKAPIAHSDGKIIRVDVVTLLRALIKAAVGHTDVPTKTQESLRVCGEFCERLISLENLAVRANLRLVVGEVKRFRRKGVDIRWEELIQEGNMGLLSAVWKYDRQSSVGFTTVAVLRIRHKMIRYIQHYSKTIRLPVSVHTSLRRVIRARGYLAAKLNRLPTEEEIFDFLEFSAQRRKRWALYYTQLPRYFSLDQPVSDDFETTYGETVADPQSGVPFTRAENKQHTSRAYEIIRSILTDREWRVLCMRFGIGGMDQMTLAEIGKLPEFGITRERVRQVEAHAIEKLRDDYTARALLRELLEE